tara:strand:+ start:314 stop:490 length:177 start_codon:yes stop_codon:yes gene_type:complete
MMGQDLHLLSGWKLDQWDLLVHKVLQDQVDLLVLKVLQDQLVLRVQQDQLVLKVMMRV